MEDTASGGGGVNCDGAADDEGVPVFVGIELPLPEVLPEV